MLGGSSPDASQRRPQLRVITSLLSDDALDYGDGSGDIDSPSFSDLSSPPVRRYKKKSPTNVNHDPSFSSSEASRTRSNTENSRRHSKDYTDDIQAYKETKVENTSSRRLSVDSKIHHNEVVDKDNAPAQSGSGKERSRRVLRIDKSQSCNALTTEEIDNNNNEQRQHSKCSSSQGKRKGSTDGSPTGDRKSKQDPTHDGSHPERTRRKSRSIDTADKGEENEIVQLSSRSRSRRKSGLNGCDRHDKESFARENAQLDISRESSTRSRSRRRSGVDSGRSNDRSDKEGFPREYTQPELSHRSSSRSRRRSGVDSGRSSDRKDKEGFAREYPQPERSRNKSRSVDVINAEEAQEIAQLSHRSRSTRSRSRRRSGIDSGRNNDRNDKEGFPREYTQPELSHRSSSRSRRRSGVDSGRSSDRKDKEGFAREYPQPERSRNKSRSVDVINAEEAQEIAQLSHRSRSRRRSVADSGRNNDLNDKEGFPRESPRPLVKQDMDHLPLLSPSRGTWLDEASDTREIRADFFRGENIPNKSSRQDSCHSNSKVLKDRESLPLLSPKNSSRSGSDYSPPNQQVLFETDKEKSIKTENKFSSLLSADDDVVLARLKSSFKDEATSSLARSACGHLPMFRHALFHHINVLKQSEKVSSEQCEVVLRSVEVIYDASSGEEFGDNDNTLVVEYLFSLFTQSSNLVDTGNMIFIIQIFGLIWKKSHVRHKVMHKHDVWKVLISAVVSNFSPFENEGESIARRIMDAFLNSQIMMELLFEIKTKLTSLSRISCCDADTSMIAANIVHIEEESLCFRKTRDFIRSLVSRDTISSDVVECFRSSGFISQLIGRCVLQDNLGNYSHVLKIIVIFGENLLLLDLLLKENARAIAQLFLQTLRCSEPSVEDSMVKFWLVKQTCDNIWLRNFLFQRDGVILEILAIMRTARLNNGDSLEVLSSFCGDIFFFDMSLSTGQIIQHFGEVFQFSENSDDVRHNAEELLLIFTEGLEKESIKQVGHKMEKKLSDISDSIATSFIESGILFMLLSVISSNDSTSEWRAKGANLLHILIRNRPIQEVFLEEPLSLLRCTVSTFEPFKDRCALFMELISIVDAIAGDAYTHARLFESEVIQDIINFISEVHENACRTKGSGDSNVNKYLLRSLNVLHTIASTSEISAAKLQQCHLEGCLTPIVKKYDDHQLLDAIGHLLSKTCCRGK